MPTFSQFTLSAEQCVPKRLPDFSLAKPSLSVGNIKIHILSSTQFSLMKLFPRQQIFEHNFCPRTHLTMQNFDSLKLSLCMNPKSEYPLRYAFSKANKWACRTRHCMNCGDLSMHELTVERLAAKLGFRLCSRESEINGIYLGQN